MLRVDLGQLDREGSVVAEANVSAEDELWNDTDLRWDGDVAVKLRATFAGTGEVVARGGIEGRLRQECRRCLKPVTTTFAQDLTLVFVSDGSEEEGDGGAYGFDPADAELELGEAVREEVVLAVNPYVVCDPECKGLCSRCGADLNEGPCDCSENEVDPRWEALRNLKSE
jgi:uncharacterized protein